MAVKLQTPKWYVAVGVGAVAIVAGLSAARILAQAPAGMPVDPTQQAGAAGMPGDGGGAPAAPKVKPLPGSPMYPIPFAQAPHGPVKRYAVTSPGGGKIEYYRFTSKTDRTYIVDMPASQVKGERSKDEWITLFASYGRDPRAEATTRALTGGAGATAFSDHYNIWMAKRIADQILKVTFVKRRISTRANEMNLWSAIHQEARDDDDKLRAQAAWARISTDKRELRGFLREIAGYKLQLGHLYKEAGAFEQAREQYRQTAQLQIFPYSAEAISKLRVIEGQQPSILQPLTAGIVGIERMSLSDLYQAAVRASSTTP
ncbi:MAG: hypothetical protein IT209_09860 [Armatimonadetes bacterium]|nr:hypothetical protein [Armatimonadota bacterium]